MLRITVHENDKLVRLELAGKLRDEWVAETEKAWQAAGTGKVIEVDLTKVTGVDEAGRMLLRAMIRGGASLTAKGLAMTALVEECRCGEAPAEIDRQKKRAGGIAGILLALLLLPAARVAAEGSQPQLRLPIPRLAVSARVIDGGLI